MDKMGAWGIVAIVGGVAWLASAAWMWWEFRHAPEEEWPGQYG